MKVNELYGNEPITIESYLEKCGVEDNILTPLVKGDIYGQN